MPGQQQQQQQ